MRFNPSTEEKRKKRKRVSIFSTMRNMLAEKTVRNKSKEWKDMKCLVVFALLNVLLCVCLPWLIREKFPTSLIYGFLVSRWTWVAFCGITAGACSSLSSHQPTVNKRMFEAKWDHYLFFHSFYVFWYILLAGELRQVLLFPWWLLDIWLSSISLEQAACRKHLTKVQLLPA